MSSKPKCHFSYKTLIAKIGNSYKGYEELECIQVPSFTKTISEKACLGKGWYGGMTEVKKTFDRFFVIMKDNKPFGLLDNPYDEDSQIKTDILPLNAKYFPEIINFIKTLNK